MSARQSRVWPLLILALTLSGCATLPAHEIAAHRWPAEVVYAGDLGASPAASPHASPVLVRASGPGGWNTSVKDAADAYIIEPARHSNSYHLDTGDRLRVFVYGQPNLSRLYTVDQSGRISVPLIGPVRARGRTTYQVEAAIRARLASRFVRDPVVTVDVHQNRPFFILGEVRNAGQFPYVSGMTIEMGVATAGGYSERANERRARLTRRIRGVAHVFEASPGTEIRPGDTIYIYERFF